MLLSESCAHCSPPGQSQGSCRSRTNSVREVGARVRGCRIWALDLTASPVGVERTKMSSSTRQKNGASATKASARRFVSALVVSSVLLAAMLGGQRYLYCYSMNEVMTRATCACATAHAPDEATSVGIQNDCFEARMLGRLASFALVGQVT